MAKTGRNAPCPCGSGKKYKKCCLSLKEGGGAGTGRFIPVYTELDQLSNSVVELIGQNRLDRAGELARKLLAEYPDQINGLDRLAMVFEARGENGRAAEYYAEAAAFAGSHPDFDDESVGWFLSEERRVREKMRDGENPAEAD